MFENRSQIRIVVVAALGYFVDIYDLILFGIVRLQSLNDLGVSPEKIAQSSLLLLNMQMVGMLVGGVLFGVWGDRKGRVQVLFASILLYSLANIANGFVNNIPMYAIVRFIAGLGLAGELGAGITLVSETMHKTKRGYGTMVVVLFGALGAVVAALVADLFSWRISYFVGGALGLMLLIMRIKSLESGLFSNMMVSGIKGGQFLALFKYKELFFRFMNSVLIGLPVWFVVGILIVFSPEFGQLMKLNEPIVSGKAVMWSYIGLSVGDVLSGLLSQWIKSRKKAVFMALLLGLMSCAFFLFGPIVSTQTFYLACFLVGLPMGYWGLFVTIASESFGTNLRATVTTTVPNLVRGATVPITLLFAYLNVGLGFGMVYAAACVGLITFTIAFYHAYKLKETFGKDLNFVEKV